MAHAVVKCVPELGTEYPSAMKLLRSSALKRAPRAFKCRNNLAEKATMAKPRCAELIGIPHASVFQSFDRLSKCLTCA